ncbi:MAG: DUF11 domain-containing protein [Deltaproteobacteria bacterium]|nr:DUF11 domain-containing protein [Deltaproteobacteria bacterium]
MGKSSRTRISYMRQVLTLLLLFLTNLSAYAGIDEWTSTGPGGGLMSAIAVAPSNPDIVYAGTNGTVFKSTNGGAFWTVVNNSFPGGSYPTILAVDPQNPDLVYMDFAGFFISRDGGTTWSVALEFGQIYSVAALVFDPLDHNTVYAAGAGVWKSTDAGVSWTQLATNSVAALTIYHTDAAQPAILYAESGSGGVAKSIDGGMTWSSPVAVGYYYYGANGLAVDPTNPDIVYASNREIYRSADGGATWTLIYAPLDSNYWAGKLLILPQQPNVLYAMLGGTLRKMIISVSGTVQSNTSLFGSVVYTNSVVGFSIAPQQLTTIYVGTGGRGILKSVDSGATWNESNTGIANLLVNDIALDPQEPANVYARSSDLGGRVFSSADHGEVWRSLDSQIQGRVIHSLAVARTTAAEAVRVYIGSGNSVCQYQPLFNGWDCRIIVNGLFTETPVLLVDPTAGPGGADVLYAVMTARSDSVYKSIDSGYTWGPKQTSLPPGVALQEVMLAPQAPTTLYAIGALGNPAQYSIYKSTDGADHWSVMNFPAGMRPFTMAVDPHDSDTLYVGVISGVSQGVYKSTDGGDTWTPKNTGLTDALGPFAIGTVAIDPQLPTTLYVGTFSTSSKGIFKSIDSGEHWTPLNNGLPESAHYPFALAVDPQDTARVYAGTAQHGVMWIQQTLTADLAVSKTDAPDPATVGKPLTYTITVTNYGPDPATGVAITESLPSGLTLVSATPSQGTCSQPSVLSCQLGGLTKDASATITVVVTPTATGIVNNSVSVTATVTDPNPDNNTATAVTTVELDRVDDDGDGYSEFTGDCNDASTAIHPGVAETCNHVDDNCNGQVDDGLPFFTSYPDIDGDGYGDAAAAVQDCLIPAGYITTGGDCRDADSAIKPGAPEVCNETDDNCNGQVDEGLPTSFFYYDGDGDTYGIVELHEEKCRASAGYVVKKNDCNDANALAYPGAPEVCGDGRDYDCCSDDPTCPPQAQLVGLEATQTVQDWKNSVQLSYDKQTYVRAHIDFPNNAITRVKGTLEAIWVRPDGSETLLKTLTSSVVTPECAVEVLHGFGGISTVKKCDVAGRRGTIRGSLNFRFPARDLPSGTIKFRFNGQSIHSTCNSTFSQSLLCGEPAEHDSVAGDCTVQANVQPPVQLKVKLVRVRWRKPLTGETFEPTPADVTALKERLRAIYPTSDILFQEGFLDVGNFSVTPPGPGQVDQSSTIFFGLVLLPQLKDQRNAECASKLANCWYRYYGVVKGLSGQGVGGQAAGIPSFVSAGSMPDQSFAFGRNRQAHEIGHSLGERHAEFCGATGGLPFPYSAVIDGKTVATLGPMNAGAEALVYGLDSYNDGKGPRVIAPTKNFELMSYCGGLDTTDKDRWVSKHTYERLRLDIYAANLAEAAASQTLTIREVNAEAGATTVMTIRGTVDLANDALTFLPFMTTESSSTPELPEPGDYALQLHDAAGAVLQDIPFKLDVFESDFSGGGTEPEPTIGGFSLVVVANPSVERVVILHQGNVIGQRSASVHAPGVTVLSPNGGEHLSGQNAVLQWMGSDADGDSLSYLVQYSADDGVTWETLAVDWPDTTFTVPLSALAGTTQGRIQVVASDGFRSASDQSNQVFTVGNHAPEVSLLAPENGRLFTVDEEVPLKATASDTEDGNLSGASVVWTSSRDGTLGTGDDFNVSMLSEGEHDITVTATDSAGSSVSASTHVRVVAAFPDVLANLAVMQLEDAASPANPLPFSAVVVNNGPNPATGVTLHIAFTGGVAGIVPTPSQGNCTVTGKMVSCALGAIAHGEAATVAFNALATAAGEITHTATANGNEVDPALVDNTDTRTVLVTGATAVEICGNCVDDDNDGQIDLLDPDCQPLPSLAIKKGSFTLNPRVNKDRVSLQSSFGANGVSIDPPAEGLTVSFIDGDGKIACFAIPPGSAGWSVAVPGAKWSFTDAADDSLGDPEADERFTITRNAAKGVYEVKVTIKEAELLDPDAGLLTTGVVIGEQRWRNQQPWKAAAKGKKLVTP